MFYLMVALFAPAAAKSSCSSIQFSSVQLFINDDRKVICCPAANGSALPCARPAGRRRCSSAFYLMVAFLTFLTVHGELFGTEESSVDAHEIESQPAFIVVTACMCAFGRMQLKCRLSRISDGFTCLHSHEYTQGTTGLI